MTRFAPEHEPADPILENLTEEQRNAVTSPAKRLLVVAGAGSGKTEVMSRRVAWWVAREGVDKSRVLAITFMEKAAEEMKFRIRRSLLKAQPNAEDATLGDMYVGTIHAFCVKMLKEMWPERYHNYDILDDMGRYALIQYGHFNILRLENYRRHVQGPQGNPKPIAEAAADFLRAYNLLHEFDRFEADIPASAPPTDQQRENEWIAQVRLRTPVGGTDKAAAFADSAARYYGYLLCRRFLDFATVQSELVRRLRDEPDKLAELRARFSHVLVDEVQDINPVQDALIRLILGNAGTLTAVGDHRQAIFRFRGGQVRLMETLHTELAARADGATLELRNNFRSTPRIVNLANSWASLIQLGGLRNPEMRAARRGREDFDPTHVGTLHFARRADEADWIAERIQMLVPGGPDGAQHDDVFDGAQPRMRGLTYADVAVLIRNATDARVFQEAMQARGIPVVVTAGANLFAQPEVLLFTACLARAAGINEFQGSREDRYPNSLPNRVSVALGCTPDTTNVIHAAVDALRTQGLPLATDLANRLVLASDVLRRKIVDRDVLVPAELWEQLRSPGLKEFARSVSDLTRIFPQTIYHDLLEEADVGAWDLVNGRAQAAMFHLGQLSALVRQLEAPGWTDPGSFRWQIEALAGHGTREAKIKDSNLLTQPDAVTLSTIHSAKGLEFAAVFVADVNAMRFPHTTATQPQPLPYQVEGIDPGDLVDDGNNNQERRLMYVALTRAQRYLFVTQSLNARGRGRSKFHRQVAEAILRAGGTNDDPTIPTALELQPSSPSREMHLVASFTDLNYYRECSHDYYLRNVLGFNPGIPRSFGYGQGVHNILREIHDDPARWAGLAARPGAELEAAIGQLADSGLFYLRYTRGQPATDLRNGAVRAIARYVRAYAQDLGRLEFQPERAFETLIPEANVLITGAIDLIQLDDPPQVTLVDFKSGHAPEDPVLDTDAMRKQVQLYALAARRELEYAPQRGLVRYLGEPDEDNWQLEVPLDGDAIAASMAVTVAEAEAIKRREFFGQPTPSARYGEPEGRCATCDFRRVCGLPGAVAYRARRSAE